MISPLEKQPPNPEKPHITMRDLEQSVEKFETKGEKLRYLLGVVDKTAFPNSPISVRFIGKFEDGDSDAAYSFDDDERGKPLNNENHVYEIAEAINPEKTEFLKMIRIAMHEVRHRVQHANVFESLTADSLVALEIKHPQFTNAFKSFVGKVTDNSDSLSELTFKRKEPELSPREYEAKRFEDLTLAALAAGASLQEVVEKILTQDSENAIINTAALISETK